MPTYASVLAAAGLGMPDLIAQVALEQGMDVAGCAALTAKETGGRNIWGHDGVDTDGCYDKGGPVTPDNYRCVRASPRAGYNGAGPGQLTWVGYWDAADRLRGVPDPWSNLTVSFQALRDLQRQYGPQDGARAYNGSGPQAVAYGADWVRQRARFAAMLAAVNTPGSTPAPQAPAPGTARPVLHQGDTGPLVWALQKFMRTNYGLYCSNLDPGPGPSSVIGPVTRACIEQFQQRSGIPTDPPFEIGPRTWAALTAAGFRG